MNFSADNMRRDLQAHAALCGELLALATAENQTVRSENFGSAPGDQRRKNLLPRLDESLALLRIHRRAWQQLSASERAGHAEIPRLIRTTQDLIMKIIVLDRENEQALLRRGLVPARHLSSARQQQPHYVANLYQRHRT